MPVLNLLIQVTTGKNQSQIYFNRKALQAFHLHD